MRSRSPRSRRRSALHDFASVYRKVLPSVVTIRTSLAAGTGFVLSKSRLIATCAHVVDDEPVVRVMLASGAMFHTEVLFTDFEADVAFLDFRRKLGLPGLDFAGTNGVEPGTPVALIGKGDGNGLVLTSGVVSALRESNAGLTFVQTTAPMNPGVSGAPLFDLQGRIVGMATSSATDAQAVNFALAGIELQRRVCRAVVAQRASGRRRNCLGCKSPLAANARSCGNCGKLTLEIPLEGVDMKSTGKPLSKKAAGECMRIVEAALEEVGFRVDPGVDEEFDSLVWEFRINRSKVFVIFTPGEADGLLQVRALVAKLPRKRLLELYRRLLELNAEHLPSCALGVTADFVTLATARTAISLKKSHVKEMLRVVAEAAGQVDDHLIKEFGCRPIPEE